MSLRLPTGRVTVMLGPSVARRRMMNRLDDAGGRCADGHGAEVTRLTARAVDPVESRLAALGTVRESSPALVLVDRFTDGLATAERRVVLAAVAALAAVGPAVLVDDLDPVAGLAVADGALRVDGLGGAVAEDLAYLAS